MREILRSRLKDVAARPQAPDPDKARAQVDADRQRQLAALQAAPEPSKEAEGGDPASAGEYRVEQSGTWYKLIDPDGEQVGKSVRSEDDAWAQKDSEG